MNLRPGVKRPVQQEGGRQIMWLLIGFLWVAASVIVIAPLVNEIEMLEIQSQRIFSYIILVLIAPAVIVMEYGIEALEKIGLKIEDDDDNDKDLWE